METTTQKNKMTCPYIFGDTYYITNISILYNYNIGQLCFNWQFITNNINNKYNYNII